MNKYAKFAALMAIVVGTLLWLATAGSTESETYYKTVKELNSMSGKSRTSKIRVGGDVASGSIVRKAELVEFTLKPDAMTTRSQNILIHKIECKDGYYDHHFGEVKQIFRPCKHFDTR